MVLPQLESTTLQRKPAQTDIVNAIPVNRDGRLFNVMHIYDDPLLDIGQRVKTANGS